MFTRKNVLMHLSGCSLKLEALTDDVTGIVGQIRLSLEPLTPALAKELGPDIAEHCFTRQGKIRDEMTRLQCRLRLKPQMVTSRMAEDAEPHAVLRLVRFKTLTIVKRGEDQGEKVEKKGKKVKPQKEVLRLSLAGLVDMAEPVHREFLCKRFGDTLMFTFEDEARGLPLEGPNRDDDDGAADELPLGPGIVPGTDTGAGDVLEEQAAKPRLAKAAKTKGSNGTGART